MATGFLERSEASATRCEMDLSGGTESSPRRLRAGAICVIGLSKVTRADVFEYLKLLFGERAVAAFGEGAQSHGADTHALQGDQTQADRGAGASYYAVTALMDGEVEGGFPFCAAEVCELRW